MPNSARWAAWALSCLVVPLTSAQSSSQDGAAAPPAPPPDEGERPGPTTLPGDVVEGERPSEYAPASTGLVTRTRTPVDELPFSVRVLDAPLVRDVGARSLADVTRYSAGVAVENIGGFLGPADSSFLRGFRNNTLYWNGYLVEAIPSVNPTRIDRVEVLRGPNSVLYGTMQPGGMINVVPKAADGVERFELLQRFGSWEYHETAFDVGGVLDREGAWSYRVDGGSRDNESFRDHFQESRQWIAPSVRWRPDADTDVHLDLSYSEHERVIDEGVAFSPTGGAVAPIDTFLGEPGFPGQRYSQLLADLGGTFGVGEGWTWRTGVLASWWRNDMNGVRRSAPTNNDDTVNRLFEDSDFSQESFQVRNELLLDGQLGGADHELLVGLDVRKRSNDLDLRRGAFGPTSIVNPTYGGAAPAITTIADLQQELEWASLYAQEQLDLMEDDLHLNAAVRLDWTRQTNENFGSNSTDRRYDDALTARLGALYDVTEDVGVYASAGQSFVPAGTGAMDVNGDLLDPETGIQYEVGTKIALFGGRAQATVALFELTKEDVVIGDVNNPGFSINAGELRSRGVEVEMAGEVTSRLALVGNYTYTDTEVVESSSLPEGARFRNIPYHSAAAWLKWRLPEEVLGGLEVGLGLRGVSGRSGDDQGTFSLPGFATLDLALMQRALELAGARFDLQVNVTNVLDQTFYESSLANSRVFPGTPRALLVSLRLL